MFVIHNNTYFNGLWPIAQVLAKQAEFAPVFLFLTKYSTLDDEIEACRKENIAVLLGERIKGASQQQAAEVGKVRRSGAYLDRLKSLFVSAGSYIARLFGWNVLKAMRKLSRQINTVRQILQRERISLLVLPADNRYDQAAYVKAAHLEGMGVVVVPQFMASPLEWAEYVWDKPDYQVAGIRNRLASILYPRWVYHYKGRRLIALPGAQVIAREWLGIAPPSPWTLHSGAADALALESEALRDYCLAEGLPPSNMVVTGSLAHDIMSDALAHRQEKRAELCAALGLDASRPLILSALPPDNLYMGRPECDFQVYADLVKFWCQSISSIQGCNHILVLHPSLRYDDMQYIEAYGLKIARMPTLNVIPLCDIYVASISSTIQWAIACGKPVVNYDVFRYRYTDYQNVKGVVTMEEQGEFLSVLRKLTADPEYLALITSYQKDCSEHWGRLDGKAAERLQNVFGSTTAAYARK